MGFSNVVCFVLHGLLVTAFPTGDSEFDGIDLGLLGVPEEEIAEVSGCSPASGYCSIVGQSPCPDLLPVTSPLVTPENIVLENNDGITYDTENDEDLVPINTKYDEASNRKIPNKVILCALIADAIMKEKGAEVDATLAELDAFVEAEIESLGPIIKNVLANADTLEVDRCVDTALLEIESKIASELAMVDAFIDSELIRTEKLVESVTDNAHLVGSLLTIAQCLNETNFTEMENCNMTETEALVAMELAMLESFVESQLAKAEAIIDAELEKVNSFVESELAKVDGIVDSALAKVDLFVETELAKTDAHVKSKLSKMELFVDAELAKVEPAQGTVDYSDVPPAAEFATNDESLGYGEFDEEVFPLVEEVFFSGVAPAEGRCKIFGVSPCDTLPLINRDNNMSPPMVGEASPFITKQVTESCNKGCLIPPGYMQKTEPVTVKPHIEILPTVDVGGDVNFSGTVRATGSTSLYAQFPYGEFDEEVLYEDVIEVPLVGEVFFSGVASAEGSCVIFGVSPCDTLPSINKDNMSPAMVGEASFPVTVTPQILPTVDVGENVSFSGTVRATGSTSLYAHFPCAPLTATEVGPDGKKYIWIAKKPAKNVPPPQPAHPQPRPDFPAYTEDFPETIIMDSTKNYEKLISENLDVDFEVLGPVAVAGEAFFEGTVPAFGSVSIRGHCA